MKHLRYPDSRKPSHGTVYEGSDNYRLGNIPTGYQTGPKAEFRPGIPNLSDDMH